MKSVELSPDGLQGDRVMALCDPTGQLITGRAESSLVLLRVTVQDQLLSVSFKNEKRDFALKEGNRIENRHFSARFNSVQVSKEADQWFSDFLGRECHLIAQDPHNPRMIKSEYGSSKLHMPDAGPVLLLNKATLNFLRGKCPDYCETLRFRPNLLVDASTAYEEHDWQEIQIGHCKLKRMKDCSRCNFTTVHPLNGVKNRHSEPLRTLSKLKVNERGEAVFGVYFIPKNTATIALGDQLEILSTLTHSQ